MRLALPRVRQYELMTIFSPEVSEEDLVGAIEHVTTIVADAGGTVTLINRESPWGRRRLAYPIRYNSRDVRDGLYVLYYLDIDASKVIEVERDLKLTETIMRYMVTQQVAPQMIPASELEAAAAAIAAADAQEAAIDEEFAAATAAAEAAANAPAEVAVEADAEVAETVAEAVPEVAAEEGAAEESGPEVAVADDESGEQS